jgi:hypothetical protein
MRLLQRNDAGAFSLTEVGNDTIPPYAILSHTWVEDQEVTLRDVEDGTGKSKTGYDKLRFCAEQAKRDGLQYFWVDTCCIDKSNHAEVSQEINAMFRRYREAQRCYVYLSDVSAIKWKESARSSDRPWEHAFRASRWFTRGWTLQELLAPRSVEFFSLEGQRLGDKDSVERQIHEITGIPRTALQGAPLCQFNVQDRLSWTERRETKREEDKAYSLLGIFDVYIAAAYGEGFGNALRRLLDENTRLERCMQDLCISDPRDDKKRIEETKGGLLKDSYRWILENSNFRQWRHAQQNTLLWVKGDPGKGKTMLLCGVIDELEQAEAQTSLLSYFFCQATDARINNATAVLRGLIYMLVRQQPSLVSHLRKKYDQAGKKIFEDANAWFALHEILINIIQDPSLGVAFMVIDALDECITDLPKLLRLIDERSAVSSRVKWIVSSRNWPQIEQQLNKAKNQTWLSLELNAKFISEAVDLYIKYKVLKLAQDQGYDDPTQTAILHHLLRNADGTFLWVALVCQNLMDVEPWHILEILNEFPPGLDLLYKRMLEQICSSRSAGPCQKLLAVMMSLFRPVTLTELISLVKISNVQIDERLITRVIGLCGSFLTVRNAVVYFVHQSAKDFLLDNATDQICPSGQGEVHQTIFTRSLHVMTDTLQRDIYNLQTPGNAIEQFRPSVPDPLVAIRYACVFWIDHVCAWLYTDYSRSQNDIDCWGSIHTFIKEKYLYWLEALSLCRSMSEGVLSIAKLYNLIQVLIIPYTTKQLARIILT